MDSTPSSSKIQTIFRVACGNFLEMFDFMVFGYYATEIAKAFFPSQNEFTSLMLSLSTFGAGFLMRPLGAVVLGAYIDKHGRRKGLLLTLALMSIGTLSIACMPTYASIGMWAPLLVLAGRLLQGFSAGVELGGVSVYLSEIAPPGRMGFYVSWQSASQQVAVMFAALLGVLLHEFLPTEAIEKWGWRIPFLVGCLIIPYLFRIRSTLQETEVFLARQHQVLTFKRLLASLAGSWKPILVGSLVVTFSTILFYLITAYTPTFGGSVLHLNSTDNLIVTLCVGASNLFWVPFMAHFSDRIGRLPILRATAFLALLTAYPALYWLTKEPSFSRMLAVELWFSVIYGSYNGAGIVYLTEIMPIEVRTTGFSIAYSLAVGIFGGFTAMICTYLIHETGSHASPGLWVIFGSICGLVSTFFKIKKQAT